MEGSATDEIQALPGNPFIYYGEEIGMLGVKPDEGLREPMKWTADGQGDGQTTWEQAKNNAANSGADVESQLQNRGSLLEHYRQLISLRNEVPALRDGGIREYSSGNSGIMAFERITAGSRYWWFTI
ncbi:alpha-amylase family glycosyl hydrolase [Paenibacillus sp. IHBB 3054]|uniref:alpha-amylase family glycosyl hydrolase n=1 Tax=Paenibacillus sp. IHBB 3054 TaxID=3425689 RepID=UPI003F66E4AB